MLDRCIFLETTAVIDYTLKPKAKEKIRVICSKYDKKMTAQYVKMEIKRGVLQYLVYLHNLLATEKTWANVQERVTKLSSTPHRNRLSTILETLASSYQQIKDKTPQDIINEHGDISIDEYLKRKSKSYLRIIINLLWRNIDRVVDEIVNPMNCFPDIINPCEKDGLFCNVPRDCRKSEFECNIKEFFKENEMEFKKILDELAEIPPDEMDSETLKRKKSLKERLRLLPYGGRKFSNKEPNRKDCWNCSDAILAVLAPPASDVLNNNQRHYNPICTAIRKRSVTY